MLNNKGLDSPPGDRCVFASVLVKTLTKLYIFVFIISYPVWAESGGNVPTNDSEDTGKIDFFHRAHQKISENVIHMGDRLDDFFGEDRIFESGRESLLKISTIFSTGEDKDDDLRLRASLRYVLPNAENHFSILVGREPPFKEISESDLTDSDITPKLTEEDNASYTGALRYTLPEWERWDSDFDIGLKFRSNPVWYSKFRVRRIFDWDPWALRITNKSYWFDDDEFGNTLRFDVERNIGYDLFFRASTSGTVLENEHGMQYDEVLTLIKNGTHKQATALQAIAVGKTKPENKIIEYALRLKYRRQLNPKWLFLELRPEVAFPEARDYNTTWRIKIELQTLFGDEVFWK